MGAEQNDLRLNYLIQLSTERVSMRKENENQELGGRSNGTNI